MRDLTVEETEQLEQRRARFDQFLSERLDLLTAFAQALDLAHPPKIVAEPEHFLPAIDLFMRQQVVDPADRTWIRARLGYFLGELLAQRLRGAWLVNATPESRSFLRYVVGNFSSLRNRQAMVDPFQIADAFLNEPPGRSLSRVVQQIEEELGGV